MKNAAKDRFYNLQKTVVLLLLMIIVLLLGFLVSDNYAYGLTTIDVTNGQRIVYQYRTSSGLGTYGNLQFNTSSNTYCEIINTAMSSSGSGYIYTLHIFPKKSTSLSSNTIVEVYDPDTETNIDILVFNVKPPEETYSITRGNSVTLSFNIYQTDFVWGQGPVSGVYLSYMNGNSSYRVESFDLINDPLSDYDGVGGVFTFTYNAKISFDTVGTHTAYLMSNDGYVLKILNINVQAGANDQTLEMGPGDGRMISVSYSSPNIQLISDNDKLKALVLNKISSGSVYFYTIGFVSSDADSSATVRSYDPDTDMYLDTFTINTSTVNIAKTTCIDHRIYIGGLTNGYNSDYFITITGSGNYSYQSGTGASLDPFANNYPDVDAVLYNHFINFTGNSLGTYTINFYNPSTNTLDYSVQVNVKEHDLGEATVTTEATCYSTGIASRKCLSCDDTIREMIPMIDHTWNDSYTIDSWPTCTEEGSQSVHCKVCNAINEDTIKTLPVTDHTYPANWTVTESATCTENGLKIKKCVVCGNTISEDIAAIGHIWNTDYTIDNQPTCTQEGSKSIHCSVCNVIDESTVISIPIIDHNYGEWTVTKEADCTEDGSKEKTCSECGHKITGTIPAKGHTWNEKYTEDKSATCTEEGSESIHCAVCDAKKEDTSRPIALIPHSIVDVVTPAGLEADGTIEHKCSACGFVESSEAIPHINTVKLSATAYTYSGSTKKPTVTVNDTAGNKLVKDTDFTVTYTSGRKAIGKYKVTVKFKGKYAGEKALSFAIKPPKVTNLKVTSPKAKQLKVAWTKAKGGVSYQIWYKVKGTSTWKKTTATGTSKLIKSLKGGKTYQVKVRAYKKVSGTTYTGAWTSVKTVKVKK